jgi:hypothetical protein
LNFARLSKASKNPNMSLKDKEKKENEKEIRTKVGREGILKVAVELHEANLILFSRLKDYYTETYAQI